MDLFRSKRYVAHEPLPDERPAKRISTPAGQRLSLIIESTTSRKSKTPASKINVTTTSTFCNDPEHQHIGPYEHTHPALRKSDITALKGGTLTTTIESSEDRTPNGSDLSVSVWSRKGDAEKFGQIRQGKHRGAGGWWSRKRLAIVAAIAFVLIIALVIGLAFGLKKSSSRYAISPSCTWCEPLTSYPVALLPRRLATPSLQDTAPARTQALALAPRPINLIFQLHPSHRPLFRPTSLLAHTLS